MCLCMIMIIKKLCFRELRCRSCRVEEEGGGRRNRRGGIGRGNVVAVVVGTLFTLEGKLREILNLI